MSLPGSCIDLLMDGSYFFFPVAHLPFSVKRPTISSRKAIPCDLAEANSILSLTFQNTQLPDSCDQTRVLEFIVRALSAWLENNPVQEMSRNVEP